FKGFHLRLTNYSFSIFLAILYSFEVSSSLMFFQTLYRSYFSLIVFRISSLHHQVSFSKLFSPLDSPKTPLAIFLIQSVTSFHNTFTSSSKFHTSSLTR